MVVLHVMEQKEVNIILNLINLPIMKKEKKIKFGEAIEEKTCNKGHKDCDDMLRGYNFALSEIRAKTEEFCVRLNKEQAKELRKTVQGHKPKVTINEYIRQILLKDIYPFGGK